MFPGKVTSTKSDDGVAIGGEWYTMAGKGSFMVKRPSTGSNVDMVVVNGYVYFTDTTAGSVEDVALLVRGFSVRRHWLQVGSSYDLRRRYRQGC